MEWRSRLLLHRLRQHPMRKGELSRRAHSIDDLLIETIHESGFVRSGLFAMISSEMLQRSKVPSEHLAALVPAAIFSMMT